MPLNLFSVEISLKATLEERKEIDSSTNAGLRGSFENLKLKLHERLLRPRADPTIPSSYKNP